MEDHRGTKMVERLIQKIERRLSVLEINQNWRNESPKIAEIFQNIRIIPNKTTKLTTFEAQFERNPKT